MVSTFRRATRIPPSSNWLWVLKDAAFAVSVPLLVKVIRGRQPWEILVVPVDPSGKFLLPPPEPLATAPPDECCPTFASGPGPWRIMASTQENVEMQPMPLPLRAIRD